MRREKIVEEILDENQLIVTRLKLLLFLLHTYEIDGKIEKSAGLQSV